MSIDMKNYAGESTDSAAESPQVEQNSYQEATQTDDVQVHKELLERSDEAQPQSEAPPAPSKQELNFEALRGEIAQLKAEREAERQEYRQNLDLYRANQAQQMQRPQEEPKKFLEGLGDSDIPNVAEIRRALDEREANYKARIDELQFAQHHSDYAEVLQNHTSALLKQKPHLAEVIRNSPNPAQTAYEYGKMAQQIQAPAPTNTGASNAQKIVENARKPATLAQAGGQSVLSKADYYATMSDQEFMKMATKNLGEI